MRFYSFTNYYLSSIQQGIQPAHCIADMFVKYADESPQRATLFEWADGHKTMVCLNGGNAAGVREVYARLEAMANNGLELPFGNFHEDEQSLDSTMTCCGIVVPQHIYEASAALRGSSTVMDTMAAGAELDELELELALLLKDYGLAK